MLLEAVPQYEVFKDLVIDGSGPARRSGSFVYADKVTGAVKP